MLNMIPRVHLPGGIVTKHIIHFESFAQYIIHHFFLVYRVIALDSEWINKMLIQKVCNVQILVDDIIGHKPHGK